MLLKILKTFLQKSKRQLFGMKFRVQTGQNKRRKPKCCCISKLNKNNSGNYFKNTVTVLSAKSDSDVVFCLQSYQGLMID